MYVLEVLSCPTFLFSSFYTKNGHLVAPFSQFSYFSEPPRKSSKTSVSVFCLLKGTHLLCSPFLGMLALGRSLNGHFVRSVSSIKNRKLCMDSPTPHGVGYILSTHVGSSHLLGALVMTPIYIPPLAI